MFFQLLVMCCMCVVWRLWRGRGARAEPPELSGRLPIIGHSRILGAPNFLERLSKECLKKGGVITIYFGPFKAYGVADPEDCFTIMNTCLQKHYVFDFTKPFLGNGLTTADVPTWKIHRKLLNPSFNQHVLDSYISVFNSQARSLVNRFATELGKPFDHEYLLRINNLETICSTSLGINADDYSDIFMEYLPRLPKLVESVNYRIRKPWLHSEFIYNLTGAKKRQEEEAKHFMELSKSIIKKKKLERRNHTSTTNKAENTKTFIEILLDLADDNGCFTDEQIRDEVDTIIAGGHDTTASLLTFALTMLGSHTDVQEMAYKEIREHCVDGDIEKHDLSKLVYIEAVLKETLRLFPIFPVLGRRIDKDVKLKNYTIKANSDCILLIYGLLRHHIWGPDADQFRPERWLKKETLPDPKYYGAFGLGRRGCIGKVYAMMSTKIALAHVLRKYRVSSDVSKMVVKFQTMAKPKSGHFITLALR